VIESGEDFSVMERFFVQVLAAEPRPNIKGLRVQIKGRLAGKGGKASKKVHSEQREGDKWIEPFTLSKKRGFSFLNFF
jgi:hypothetical protein